MRRKTSTIIGIIVVLLLIVGVIAFYLYDVLWVKTAYTKNLFRMLAIVCLLIGTLLKLINGFGRKGLAIYEKAYANELADAFQDQPRLRKKLLRACRLYDESNYTKALALLYPLLSKVKRDQDAIPVLLFIAVCYTDVGAADQAVLVYYDLLRIDPDNPQVHSNLGGVLVTEGDYEAALEHYNKAIELKPDNYYAYINRANYYFKIYEYDNAIADAKQALALKGNGTEAASLLTIIYALQGDEENKKKYYHISIASGRKPADLNEAIQFFLNEQNIPSEEA